MGIFDKVKNGTGKEKGTQGADKDLSDSFTSYFRITYKITDWTS